MEKLENYKTDTDLSMPKRIAAYLDWAAQVAPGRPVSYQLIAKITMVLHKLPAEKEKSVKIIKHACRRAKKPLWDQYNRGLVPHPGFGIRATTDDSDKARTRLNIDTRRFVSAAKQLDQTQAGIVASNIHDKELKARVQNVRSTFKLLVNHDILNKLQLSEKNENEPKP